MWTRARTRVPCFGRWILNHCATREVPSLRFLLCFVCPNILSLFSWDVICLQLNAKILSVELDGFWQLYTNIYNYIHLCNQPLKEDTEHFYHPRKVPPVNSLRFQSTVGSKHIVFAFDHSGCSAQDGPRPARRVLTGWARDDWIAPRSPSNLRALSEGDRKSVV